MIKRVLKSVTTPAAVSTGIFYIVNFSLNIFRYFFHLILMRFLSPGEYGEFLSYLSLTYLLGIPTGTLGAIVTKYVSEYKGKNDQASINQFFYYILKLVFPFTTILGLLLILFSGKLAVIFKANSLAFSVLGVSMFISVFSTLMSSYLVAFQRFIFQAVTGLVSVVLNIALAIILINLKMSATGVVLAQLLTGILITVIIFYALKSQIYPRLVSKKKFSVNLLEFTGYSFLYSLGTMSLLSTDILVVRSVYSTQISGLYSSLSILGRMILFGLMPLSALILPVAANRFAARGSARTVFWKLLTVIFGLGTIGVSIFSLFPELIVRILSGSAYIAAAPLLSPFAITMFLFALSQYLLGYMMATNRSSANLILLVATIAQPLLLLFSPHSLASAVYSMLGLHFFLFLSLSIFLFVKRTGNHT